MEDEVDELLLEGELDLELEERLLLWDFGCLLALSLSMLLSSSSEQLSSCVEGELSLIPDLLCLLDW